MSSIRSILEDVLQIYEGTAVASVMDEWGEIYIMDDGDFRILMFDYLYEQSKMRLSAPHVPVFDYTKAMLAVVRFQRPQTALLLGLGGGSLVRCLHQVFPELKQTVVEIRPLMIEMAVSHFKLPVSEHLQIIQSDAKLYLQQGAGQFDIIMADLFWALAMDPMQSQKDFLLLCRRNLAPNGWLVINYDQKDHVKPELVSILYQYFDDVFLYVTPNGNAVLYAGALKHSVSQSRQIAKLQHLGLKLESDFETIAAAMIRLNSPSVQLTDEDDYGKENSTAYHTDRSRQKAGV
jgi:spermidine synthase